MQERGRQGSRIEVDLGQNARDSQGMVHVGFTGGAQLAFMGMIGHVVGALDQFAILDRQVLGQHSQESIEGRWRRLVVITHRHGNTSLNPFHSTSSYFESITSLLQATVNGKPPPAGPGLLRAARQMAAKRHLRYNQARNQAHCGAATTPDAAPFLLESSMALNKEIGATLGGISGVFQWN